MSIVFNLCRWLRLLWHAIKRSLLRWNALLGRILLWGHSLFELAKNVTNNVLVGVDIAEGAYPVVGILVVVACPLKNVTRILQKRTCC